MTISQQIRAIAVADYIAGYRDVERFRKLCRQCPRYGKTWHCPPYDFSVDIVQRYSIVHLIATQVTEPADIDTVMDTVWKITHPMLMDLEKRYPDSMTFGMACRLCAKQQCTRVNGEPCRHPDMMRHSIESFGFDVSKTLSELFGITLLWGRNGQQPRQYTFLTALFTNHDINITPLTL